MNNKNYTIGLDLGSTTVKLVLLDSNNKIITYRYRRHQTKQQETAKELLKELSFEYPNVLFNIIITGSGGEPLSKSIDCPYIQEVVANTVVVQKDYKDVKTAIELGGQDAKVIFFKDDNLGNIEVDDMRMNGVCAGGTGAFIDQISKLLGIDIDDFENIASKGEDIYNISGRCGVFATTDIQTLLNQGVKKEDIALSSLYALAYQTIGGLSQGKTFNKKVIFEGGVLKYNPTLIKVFQKILNLKDSDIIIPKNPEVMIAYGAALSIDNLFRDKATPRYIKDIINKVDLKTELSIESHPPLFNNLEDEFNFKNRLKSYSETSIPELENIKTLEVYIGIDSGSTTSKFVVMDSNKNILNKFYNNNCGDPLKTVKNGLFTILEDYQKKGIKIDILGIGTTGYGEDIMASAFNANYKTVETLAHYEAAMHYSQDTSFILDIGGQDIKAIFINKGIITQIILNEACSSGCGTFLENYASSINLNITDIAQMAFNSKQPSKLGSRCTIFMNSSITTELRAGKSTEDIVAGLCYSLIENIFTKILRISNYKELGDNIVVQGGVSKNGGVIRALEKEINKEVYRPPHPELMGAIGVALLTMKLNENRAPVDIDSLFIDYTQSHNDICSSCSNRCSRTATKFSNGNSFIMGNKCYKGGENSGRENSYREEDLLNRYIDTTFFSHSNLKNRETIGIPRVLEFYESYPFWRSFFESLGYNVLLSPESSVKLLNRGLNYVPSDTVCLPGKVSHGHIEWLKKKRVDKIFWPMMICKPKKNRTAENGCYCPVVQGYPLAVKENHNNITIKNPIFHWYSNKLKDKQIINYFVKEFKADKKRVKEAINSGEKALLKVENSLKAQGAKLIDRLKNSKDFAVVIAGRPYQYDRYINHRLSEYITQMGIPVLTIDNIPDLNKENIKTSRNDNHVLYHTKLIEAAYYVAKNPNLELIQLISFSCGHDAILSDEIKRINREITGREHLQLKLDEVDSGGSIKLRIKSFIETVKIQRDKADIKRLINITEPYPVKFLKKDKKRRAIIVPHLSPTFSYAFTEVFRSKGFDFISLPVADSKAIELGKKYIHNDICFPAQINIGEIFRAIESGKYKDDEVAVTLSKNCDYCRSGQYQVVAREALDANGYKNVPIITTGVDYKKLHPGFRLDVDAKVKLIRTIAYLDTLEKMTRIIRCYEKEKGESDRVFEKYRELITKTIINKPAKIKIVFKSAVASYNSIPLKNTIRKPRVCIIGEILVAYHTGANRDIERYLESYNLEVYAPSIIDFFRRDPLVFKDMAKRDMIKNAWLVNFLSGMEDRLFSKIEKEIAPIYNDFKFAEEFHPASRVLDCAKDIVDPTYYAGEGWLIPGAVIDMINSGISSFVIIQPFGCMSNHITGRGLFKTLKERYPHINIQALDFDPDTSLANIENRLQMLIHSTKNSQKELCYGK